MIAPHYLPPDAYYDDPAEHLDRPETSARTLAIAMAYEGYAAIGSWITHGKVSVMQRALRSDIVLLRMCAHHLPCELGEHPSAAWLARQHGISRQRVSVLQQEYLQEIGPHILDASDNLAERFERPETSVRTLAIVMARAGYAVIGKWITHGRGSVMQRALCSDIFLLCMCPQNLPCGPGERPSAAWLARQHGISRQRVSLLQQEFAQELGPHIQFRGMRFLNKRVKGCPKTRKKKAGKK